MQVPEWAAPNSAVVVRNTARDRAAREAPLPRVKRHIQEVRSNSAWLNTHSLHEHTVCLHTQNWRGGREVYAKRRPLEHTQKGTNVTIRSHMNMPPHGLSNTQALATTPNRHIHTVKRDCLHTCRMHARYTAWHTTWHGDYARAQGTGLELVACWRVKDMYMYRYSPCAGTDTASRQHTSRSAQVADTHGRSTSRGAHHCGCGTAHPHRTSPAARLCAVPGSWLLLYVANRWQASRLHTQ